MPELDGSLDGRIAVRQAFVLRVSALRGIRTKVGIALLAAGVGMDPIALITTALAAGAGAAVKDEAPAEVKGLYEALWAEIKHRLSSRTDAEVVLDGHLAAPEVWAWLSSELAAMGVSDDLVAAAQALMRMVDAEGSQASKYDVDAHGDEGGDNNIQNSTFMAPAAQPTPVAGRGASGMARITYQVEGDEEPRVAVFLPGLKIEGRESDVAQLGFPPVNLRPAGT
jgi:hypothetical protein